jgi:hypothetical protein
MTTRTKTEKTEEQRGHTCPWAHSDTCRACRAGERSIVMSVNKEGVKK